MVHNMKSIKCAIWGTPLSGSRDNGEGTNLIILDSPRAGGEYKFDWRSQDLEIPLGDLDERGKVRLTTWLVNKREEGEGCPQITLDSIRAAQNGRKMLMKQRLERILQFLEKNGEAVTINTEPNNTVPEGKVGDKDKMLYQLLAYSESTEWFDLKGLLDHLGRRGLIEKSAASSFKEHQYYLTIDGALYLDESRKVTPDSDKVFVAMWFHSSVDSVYDNAIAPAIKAAGYVPKRADRAQFVDQVSDWIIGQIRQARFVVADFSQGIDGARGGVYYEAGFAHGLGRKVVFTCRKEDEGKIHFDTNHYNHIFWEDEEELKKRLEERIIAVMGDGPHKGETPEN